MIFTKQNLIYFGVALIVGAVFAFGISSFTYQPVPLQATENPYAPITPPAPAVTILPPQYVPGSYADANKNTTGDPYAPAAAPVVVTTAPLPSITPVPILSASGTKSCSGSTLNPVWNQTLQNVNSQVQGAYGSALIGIGIGIIAILVGIVEPSPKKSSSSNGLGGLGGIGFIVAVMGVLISLYIIAVVIGSITAAVTCIP